MRYLFDATALALMRSNILAFALGACLLQLQPELPPLAYALVVAPLLAAGLWLRTYQASARAGGAGAAILAPILLCTACLAAGFFYAAAWAQLRLSDRLAPEWEGPDLLVTGAVAGLPQPFERGVRFDFDIETAVALAASPVPVEVRLP